MSDFIRSCRQCGRKFATNRQEHRRRCISCESAAIQPGTKIHCFHGEGTVLSIDDERCWASVVYADGRFGNENLRGLVVAE